MLIGYRAWVPMLDKNLKPVLRSFTANYIWEGPVSTGNPPVDEAEFDERFSTSSTERDESLGYFSFNEMEYLSSMLYDDDMEDAVSGAVQPFGLVRKFEKGFRSQSAQVLALSLHSKCALAECSSSADCWVVHRDNSRLTGFCSAHEAVTNDTWMQTLVGEYPAIIPSEVLFSQLGDRYQCDIVDSSDLSRIKESYGTW